MKRIIFAIMLMGFVFSIANPAAVYCEQMGYVSSTVQTDEGEVGMCRMPNGQEVDAWAFYRGEVGTEFSYCVREGYGIKSVTEDMGTWTAQYAVCVLANGTEVKLEELLDLGLNESVTPIEEYGPEGEAEGTEEPEPECSADHECPMGNVCIEGVCVEIPAEGPGPVVAPEPAPEPVPEPTAEPAPEPEPAPAAEETEFPWVPLLIVVVIIVLAYWFFIKK